jgi:hypothetical protein
VTLGLVNEEYAEVTDGLSAGDQVVVTTRTSMDFFSMMMQQSQSMKDGGEH